MDNTMNKMEKGRRAFLNGEFAEAAEHYSGVLQIQGLSESIRVNAIGSQLDSLLELGELDNARELLQQYLHEADRPDRRERKAAILHAYAKYLGIQDEPKAAIKILREELTYISSQNERYFMRLTNNYLQQAQMFLLMVELAEARVYLDLATYYMKTDGDNFLKAHYYCLEAEYMRAENREEEAQEYFLSARDLFLLSGAPWWAGVADSIRSQKKEKSKP